MKSKFTTFIMILIMILIICVLGIFAMMIFQGVELMDTTAEAEDFQTIISEVSENKETVDKNIETPKVVENPLNSIKDSSNNRNKIDYSNVSINKYFYNQLSADSQTIYKAFEANLQNMRSGNYRIELGDSFTSILNKDNGQEELENIYQSAFEAFNYDNPGVFYLNANKMFLNIETTTTTGSKKTFNVFIDSGSQSNYFTDEFSSKAQVDSAVSQVEQVKNQIIANKTGNIYQDIKMVHDYLIDNLEYDTSISRPHIYTIYGALVNKVCVCEGYARAFKYIMDSLNIPCVMVMGEGTNSQGQRENHAWNYVQLDGRWFAIDSTWDDPVVQGGGRVSNESRYKYFLKGSSTFNQDHVPSGRFTEDGKVFTYPIINSGDYN